MNNIFNNHSRFVLFQLFLLSLAAITMLYSTTSVAEEWTCTEVASIKQGNTVLTCGVATEETEGAAREKALIRAKKEFDLICEGSADCRGFETNIEPLRNTCSKTQEGSYKCYRGLRYVILDSRKLQPLQPLQPMEPSRPPPRQQPIPAPQQPILIVEEVRPFGIGISSYVLTLDHSEYPTQPDQFTGSAFWFSMAFSNNMAFRFGAYSTKHKDDAAFVASGTDMQLVFGSNMRREGFSAYIGIGLYSEDWMLDEQPIETFSGTGLVLGLGYNWSHVRLEIAGTGRESAEYTDFMRMLGANPNNQVSAASGAFMLSARF